MNFKTTNEGVRKYPKQGTIYWFTLNGISDLTQYPYAKNRYGLKKFANGREIIVDANFNEVFTISIKMDVKAAFQSYYPTK